MIFSRLGPVFFTMATLAMASPVLVPVAHAPMENALMQNRLRAPNKNVTYPATLRWTVSSSFFDRIQLNGLPDDPDDSSTTVPTVSIDPFQHRSSSEYCVT